MQIYEFLALNINDKADLVWQNGKFIDKYADLTYSVNLYFLFNFFVEVSYSVKENKITDITPFKKGFRLDKYLENIKIDGI